MVLVYLRSYENNLNAKIVLHTMYSYVYNMASYQIFHYTLTNNHYDIRVYKHFKNTIVLFILVFLIFPGMRILVMLLLDTLPMLGNVLLLCFFVFFIFGIIGVQLWEGILRQRCFLKPLPNVTYPK